MYRKLILQATIVWIHLPTFMCETPKCSNDAFDCGSIAYLAYPFWGGNRPQECGKKGYEIKCVDGVPMLKISSVSYRVTELDFSINSIKISRQDLWNNRCPKLLLNTTIDRRLFEYPQTPTDQNLTLYYQCTDVQPKLENQFSCGDGSSNFFETGDAVSGSNITCKDSILVPINKESAQSLQNPTASSVNVLQAALNSGFSIRWVFDPLQGHATFCNRNVYYSCILLPRNKFCDRNVFISCNVSSDHNASAPELQRPGMPPAQTPQGINPYPPTGNGMPPVQTAPTHHTGDKGMPPAQRPGYTHQGINHYPPTGNGSNSRRSPAKKVVIAVLLCITGVVIASILMFCFIKRRHSENGPINKECNQFVEKFLLQHGSLAPRRYKYSEIKKMTKSFSDKLGKGGYGSVYKGVLPDGSLVAVKVLMETGSNGEEFINEVASISRTSHVNIVALLGFCYEGSKRALVYEFMPNKSLDKFLSSNGETLDLQKLYEISVGIAKGLEYLHSGCSTRIVHFDIKPQNILLDEDLCPKISDFGLAKLCKKKQSVFSVIGTRGTIGYIAPEVFSRNFGGVSHKSDVYSYGMMVLEMVGARNAVEVDPSSENYFPDRIYEQVILDVTNKLDDLMIEEEEETRRKMFLIGFWCIQTIPSDRPSMAKVGEMLEGSLQSIQIPPKPFLCTPNLPDQQFSSTFSAHVETQD